MLKTKILTFLLLLVFTFSFSSAVICNPNIPNGCPKDTSSSTPSNVTIYQNITNINQTVNATVNSTQFISNNPITINLTWLTGFLDGLYCKLTGCTMQGNINMNNNNITNVRTITAININNTNAFSINNNARWECSNSTDIVIGDTTGECT